ncbi:MAG: metal ABC transporter permease [Planctomycetes bacterium]|nr:metal ABC transporter permease [Planctomycetota bacterium]
MRWIDLRWWALIAIACAAVLGSTPASAGEEGEKTLDEIIAEAGVRDDSAGGAAAPADAPGEIPAHPGLLDTFRSFPWATSASVVAGALCSLVGTIFLVRRMILLGIALPQIASAGIALAIMLAQLIKNLTLQEGQSPFLEEHAMALIAPYGSFGAVFIALVVLAWAERKTLFVEAQWGTAYIVCSALTIIFIVVTPYVDAFVTQVLEGKALAVRPAQFWAILAIGALVVLCLSLFRKEFLLISFDPETAFSLRLRFHRWSTFLYILLGATVSAGVMVMGPMFVFGYLLLPPFAARPWAAGMRSFVILSALLGASSALVGCSLSYAMDWPLSASQVIVAASVLLLSRLAGHLRHRSSAAAADTGDA